MHTPPLAGSRASTSSGTLRGLSQSARAAGVREDHRSLDHVQRVVHRGNRDMRQVDQHAQALHLADHVSAEIGQTAGRRGIRGRVGPADVHVVGQGHVPHAELVQHAQRAERGGDAMAAFGAEQRGHPAGGEDPLHVGGGQRELQGRRIGRDHPAGQVDLLEHRGDGGVPRDRGRHEDRPELGAHPARREPGQVGVGARDRFGQVYRSGPSAQRPGQVVVPVDQREPAQQVPGRTRCLTHPASLAGGARLGGVCRARRGTSGGRTRVPRSVRTKFYDFFLFVLVNDLWDYP